MTKGSGSDTIVEPLEGRGLPGAQSAPCKLNNVKRDKHLEQIDFPVSETGELDLTKSNKPTKILE